MDHKGRVVAILKAVSKNPDIPGDQESLFDSGYLDSFALPDVISELEKEFRIRIPDSDLNPGKFDTIQRIDAYVQRATAKATA